MKKLSVFLYSMGPGGAERVVSNLLASLCKRYEVHLVLMSEAIAYEIPKEVKIHFIERSNPYESGIKKLFRLTFALPNLTLKYKNLCENLDIDIHFVMLNRPCYVALFAGIIGLKGRIVIYECSTPSRIYKSGISGAVNRFLTKFLYPKADLVLANAMQNARDVVENFSCDESKTKLLYNAVDLDAIKELAKEPINDDFRPFFINIGRFDEGKNQAMLIRAVAALNDKRITLGIIGKGNLKGELERLINELNLQDQVKLLGQQKNPFKFIANSHCLLCSSRFEGFSNVLLEALACEKLIISTDHESGARELLGDNEFGILTPVDDEVAMRAAMRAAFDDENLRKTYEQRAYERVKSFDKHSIARRLVAYLEGENE